MASKFWKKYRYEQSSDETWYDEESYLSFILNQVTDMRVKVERENSIHNMQVHDDIAFAAASMNLSDERRTFEEACKDPNWLKSMEEEIKSLLDNNTWTLSDLPSGRKVVKNKWVFKQKSDGRLKSRLVAKGFTQVFGVDYEETWSPVGRKPSLNLLIWYVVQTSYCWKQMDVDTAFLNSYLDEEIYMSQPLGFEDGSSKVCRLLKSIYGLKQASRSWYSTLRDFLESQNLKRSRLDPCVYFANKLIVFVYVDDLFIAGESQEIVNNFSDSLKIRFKMKDLGVPKKLLGFTLTEISQGVHLSGSEIIEELLVRFQMDASKIVSTPMDANHILSPNESTCSHELRSNYQSAVGSLLYIANTFRPDISYAVSVLSQFTQNPSEEHWRGVKRLLRYLNGTRNYGLTFQRKIDGSNQELVGYTDADFASCHTRRSRTGYVFLVGESPIVWSSRKQPVISLSTCESEFYALTEGGKEAIHLSRLMWEFLNHQPCVDGMKLSPVKLLCDNQSTIFVSKNPAEHRNMKHVDLRYKWIQERVESGDFKIAYVSTKQQIADIFTKALTKEVFERLRSYLVKDIQSQGTAREC